MNKSILALNKKYKDLEQFAYVVALDLKSPLINISSMKQHLSKYYANDLEEDEKKLISLIQRSSNILKEQIDSTLDSCTKVN